MLTIVLGTGLDAFLMQPHATVQVTLRDGREFGLERHTVRESLTERASVAQALKNGEAVYRGGYKEPPVTASPMKK